MAPCRFSDGFTQELRPCRRRPVKNRFFLRRGALICAQSSRMFWGLVPCASVPISGRGQSHR